jgi:hypothetical protein
MPSKYRKIKHPEKIKFYTLEPNEVGSSLEGTGIEKFVNLEILSLESCGLSNLNDFPAFPKLKRLDLSGNEIDGGLEALKNCPNLTILTLADTILPSPEALIPLQPLPNLRHIAFDLYDYGFYDFKTPSATELASATGDASQASASLPEPGLTSNSKVDINAASSSASNTSSTNVAIVTPESLHNVTVALNAKAPDSATTQSSASATSSSSAPPESQCQLPESAVASPSASQPATAPAPSIAETAPTAESALASPNASQPATGPSAPSIAETAPTAEKPQASAANADEDGDELELVSVTQPGLVRMTHRIDPVTGVIVPFLLAADPADEEERRVKAIRTRIFEILPQLKSIDGVDRDGFLVDFNAEAANECVTLSSGEDSEGKN